MDLIVKKVNEFEENTLIHCSAGIGRTGTFFRNFIFYNLIIGF